MMKSFLHNEVPYTLMVKQFNTISLNCSQSSLSNYTHGNDSLWEVCSNYSYLGLGYSQIDRNQNFLTYTAVSGVNATQLSITNVHAVWKSQY